MQLESHQCYCPYCGENIELLIDDSVEYQQYIEDCSVCCSPILLTVAVDRQSGTVDVQVVAENDCS